MTVVYNLMKWAKNTIPAIIAKIGTFLFFLFTLGMISGYFLATFGCNYFILLVPIAAMAVMWQKLDEGALVFVVLMAIAFFFPEIFMT